MTAPIAPRDGHAPDAGLRVAWFAGALVLALVGAVVAWWFLAASSSGGPPAGAAGAAGSRPYLPAAHADAASARLSAGPNGKGVFEVVLRDIEEGEHLSVAYRPGTEPRAPMLFIAKGDPKTSIGALPATTSATGRPRETALRVELPAFPGRLTVVDLRFGGGRWEGFEVVASTAGAK